MTHDFIRNMIRKMLRDEGWTPQPPVIVMGPDCQPRVLK